MDEQRPDTFLITNISDFFQQIFNKDQLNALFAWLQAHNEESRRRDAAKTFLELIVRDSLAIILEDPQTYRNLLKIFSYLEEIFRMAVSIESPVAIREHLDHTIRDLLLAIYIYSRIKQHLIEDDDIKRLYLATVFHDVAYPIEKLKHGARQIDMFSQLMKAEHKQEFIISEPEVLLNILHTIGSRKNTDYEQVYKDLLCPAIASKGLYETRHNLTSVVLFLQPITEKKAYDDSFWEAKHDIIVSICRAIGYHDRKMFPPNDLDVIGKALRIADELQEWERHPSESTYFDFGSTTLEHSTESLIKVRYRILVSEQDGDFKHHIAVADKLIALIPVCGESTIQLEFFFSKPFNDSFQNSLIEELKKRFSGDYFLNMKSFDHSKIPKWEDKIRFVRKDSGGHQIDLIVRGLNSVTEVVLYV